MTGTESPEGQLKALLEVHQKTEDKYRALLRQRAPESLSCFTEFMDMSEPPAEHHEFFCEHLEALERHDLLRAAFSMPPGHAKTKFCSRFFPAWYLGRNPHHRYLQGGHAQDFCESEYGQYVRDLIASEDYREVFPEVAMDPTSRASGRWRILGNRASSYVTKGVGQGISGFRAHIGGIDDMFGKREDAMSQPIRDKAGKYLFSDFRPRLLPGSPWFLVGTRWHMDDGIGRVIELTKQGKGIPWTIINLNGIIETEEEMDADPMGRSLGEVLWPGFYTLEELMEIKATSVSSDWWALYKGSPRDEEGNVVKKSQFQRYKSLPVNTQAADGTVIRNIKRITVSVDCAEKATKRAKFTAVGVWIEDMHRHHYLAHADRKRVEFVDMIEFIETIAADWHADQILVEDAGNGTPYISQRRGKAPAPIIAIPKPSGDSKGWRFDAITPMFEAGEVHLPETARWLPDYEDELLSFPNGSFTDYIDMTSQYLSRARGARRYGSKKLKGMSHR